jgi:hypothetical protein
MEDNLKKIKMEENLNFFRKSKTTFFLYTGRRPQLFEDERQHNFYLNGRQPKKNAILPTSK